MREVGKIWRGSGGGRGGRGKRDKVRVERREDRTGISHLWEERCKSWKLEGIILFH